MTDYNLVKLIIHSKWAQAWQNIPPVQDQNSKTSVKRLPRGLVPSSLIIRDKDGTQIRFALTPEKDVDHLIEEMDVILTSQDNTRIEGKILSIKDNEITLNSGRKYVRVFKPKSIVSVKDIELNPLVSLLGIQSSNPDIYLQYILNSLSWKIHYSMVLIGKEEIKISIRAGIINNSHSSFYSKNIILMAGKTSHPPRDSFLSETRRPMGLAIKSADIQKKKLYSEDLIKVIEFGGFLKPGEMYMNTDKIYQTGYFKLYRHYFDGGRTEIIYRFDSPDQMPSGEVLVYNGNEEDFIGSSFMPESDKGQLVDLLIGESSLEITTTIDFRKEVTVNSSGDILKAEEISLTAQFTNPRQELVPVLLIYQAPRRIIKSSHKYNRKSGHTYEWLVNFQPSSDKQIITINIIQMADESKKEEKISREISSSNRGFQTEIHRRRSELSNGNPTISEISPNYGTQNSRPLSMLSIPEPALDRTFTPLNTSETRQPTGRENNRSANIQDESVSVGNRRSVEIDVSPRLQSNYTHQQAINIPTGLPKRF